VAGVRQAIAAAPRHPAPRSLVAPAWRSLRAPAGRRRVLRLSLALGAAAAGIAVAIGLALQPRARPVQPFRVAIVPPSALGEAEIAKLPPQDRETLLVFAPGTGLVGETR
jgi:hypothetical protein